ncbi:hypothetical protein DsansV1_C07g0077291 [Dioscorea sansibarensis]
MSQFAERLSSEEDFAPDPVLPLLSSHPEQVEKTLNGRYSDASTIHYPVNSTLIHDWKKEGLVVLRMLIYVVMAGELERICETDLGLITVLFDKACM